MQEFKNPKDLERLEVAKSLMTDALLVLDCETFLKKVMDIPPVNNKDTVYSGYFCPEENTF